MPGPPLAGILHASGVLRDNLIGNQTSGGMRAVFAPKVEGVRKITQYACTAPLLAVNLFSSVAASLGSGGQANYAAANSIMDSWSQMQSTQVQNTLLPLPRPAEYEQKSLDNYSIARPGCICSIVWPKGISAVLCNEFCANVACIIGN